MMNPNAAIEALERLYDAACYADKQLDVADYEMVRECILQYKDSIKSRNVGFLLGDKNG